jgi:DMSO reductase family type II enzyme heme b subunit
MTAAMTRAPVSAAEGGTSASISADIPRRMALVVLFAATWFMAGCGDGGGWSGLLVSGLIAQDGDDLGQVTYDRWCAGCHGVDGTGNGPASGYMLPRPRDFTQALYNIRTTASGALPTDEDILAIIDRGMPGTTMPGWEDLLSSNEREALVQYLKSFSRFFTPDEVPEPLEFSRATRSNADVIAEGERLFRELADCAACHGNEGRGDGESAPTLTDDERDLPIRVADLTENWLFNGGGEVEDIYRRLLTGLDGTPMPSLADVITAGVITDEQLWAVAHYVRSLSPDDPPGITEVVRGVLFEDAPLPSSIDDEAWDDVERTYLPLVGQIIVMPRWFDPRVDGVWAQAAHDGESVAVRVTWSDPNNSPDPEWADWKSQVISLMQPKEGDPQDEGPTPDQLVIQFPMEMPEGMERPFFLKGDTRRPVYLWQWQSDRDGALEGEARGVGTEAFQSEAQDLTVDASYADGEWQIMFTRPLVTEDEGDLDFVTGEAIPVAFFAWDGDNGESGTRGAVSSWYFLFLEDATPATVYVYPALAMMLTAGLGFLAVGSARKRERVGVEIESETENS